MTGEWRYLIVWEFHVRAGMEHAFEAAYGPDGDWARFFKHDEGYVGTELSRDVKDSRRYLTMDFWTSEKSYENFHNRWGAEYQQIDKRCERLTKANQKWDSLRERSSAVRGTTTEQVGAGKGITSIGSSM